MENNDILNPLYGVTIGSTITASEGSFHASVVHAPITKMITQEEAQKSMSGQSSYVYSDQMNQGSFGISGAYGASGVSLFKSSVSAYVGKSSAVSSKSVSANFNAISVGGVEYIDFEQLTASEFLAGLNEASRQGATDALEAYNSVIGEVDRLGVNLLEALQSKDPKFDGLKKLVKVWVDVSEKFTREFGDGLAVGVAWGAFGGVMMDLKSESSSSSWKYGGQADFSYANVYASVAVKAVYDGSQSGADAKVEVNCRSYVSGSVLSAQIDAWLNQVTNKSFAELADVKVLDKAPDMKISGGAPPIPDFVKPKPSDSLAGKVGQIKDLKGLELLAKASAFDQAKKDDPELTLEEFLKQIERPANTDRSQELEEEVRNNTVDTNPPRRTRPKKEDKLLQNKLLKASVSTASPLKTKLEAKDSGPKGYVPLGVWVSNWPDLLPWLAQGYYNSIDNLDGIDSVRERVMLQDYQTLSRMYYIANTSGIEEMKRKDRSLPSVKTSQIGDEFARAAGEMQSNFGNPEKIREIFDTLGESAKLIYNQWNDLSFLRNCELGMGLDIKGNTIGSQQDKNEERIIYSLVNSGFQGKNFVAFAPYFKVLPLLTPDGDIWAFGPEQGGLSAVFPNEIIFSKPGRAKYLVFKADRENKILKQEDLGINLHPIRFSASNSQIKWKGMSLSTNLGADKGFLARLSEVNEKISKLNAWSFSSENWDPNWNGTVAYRQRNIKKQYLGLISEIKNIF